MIIILSIFVRERNIFCFACSCMIPRQCSDSQFFRGPTHVAQTDVWVSRGDTLVMFKRRGGLIGNCCTAGASKIACRPTIWYSGDWVTNFSTTAVNHSYCLTKHFKIAARTSVRARAWPAPLRCARLRDQAQTLQAPQRGTLALLLKFLPS